jgi:hypothetical protein
MPVLSVSPTKRSWGRIATPDIPVLEWTSGSSEIHPTFTAYYVAAEGDVLEIQVDDNGNMTSADTSSNTLDQTEVDAGTCSFSGFTTLAGGRTHYARLKLTRGSVIVYSYMVNQFIDSEAGQPIGLLLLLTKAS